MTYEEIIEAVEEGKTVNWSNRNYIVIKADQASWLGHAIRCISNGHMSAFIKRDGTLVDKEEKFFIGELLFENESKLKH